MLRNTASGIACLLLGFSVFLGLIPLSKAAEIPPLAMRHIDTVRAADGFCRYYIGLETGHDAPELRDIHITVVKAIPGGEEHSYDTETLEVPLLGGDATGYAAVYFESLCDHTDRIEIDRATAILKKSGEKIDLLASKLIRIGSHRPLPFELGN